MPPGANSRYLFCEGLKDDEGRIFLSEREPFGFQEFADNRFHEVGESDTLFMLAHQYFSPLPRAAGLWWVIADFQDPPIIDPTLTLPLGQTVVIPSLRVLREEILNESRRKFFTG